MIYYFFSETQPEIINPESDEFVTVNPTEIRDFSRFYSCSAEGNPIPLIHWVRNDGSRLDAFNITINGSSLTTGNNIFTCFATSRIGEDFLRITIISVSEEVDVAAIDATREQVSNQTSLNEQETDDLSSLIRITVMSSNAQRMNSSLNPANETSNRTVVEVVSELYSDVVRLSEERVSRNTSENLFRTGGQLVTTSQGDQGLAEDKQIDLTEEVSVYSMFGTVIGD